MSDRTELNALLEKAAEAYRNMSAEERAEMDAAQKASFVRGMGPCEHGVRDFETCPDCRGWVDTPTQDPTAPETIGFWVHRVGQDDYVRLEQYVAVSAKLEAAEARIAKLEAENARLRAIEDAAKHVRALDEDEFEVIVGNCAYYNLRAALNKDRAP